MAILIIPTDKRPYNVELSEQPSLEQLQGWVDGYIEQIPVTLPVGDSQVIVNEEGRLKRLPINHLASVFLESHKYLNVPLVGTVVLLTDHNMIT